MNVTILSDAEMVVIQEAITELPVNEYYETELMPIDEVMNLVNKAHKEEEISVIRVNLDKVNALIMDSSVDNKKRKRDGDGRKPPIASKCCNACNNIFQVPAPQKKCKHMWTWQGSCSGTLELVAKEPKELKRPPPKCDKFCSTCNTTWENIPTGTKKCDTCKSVLEKVEKKKMEKRQLVMAYLVGV